MSSTVILACLVQTSASVETARNPHAYGTARGDELRLALLAVQNHELTYGNEVARARALEGPASYADDGSCYTYAVSDVRVLIQAGRASGRSQRARARRSKRRTAACIDCGELGEQTGHQDCQYPGRYSS
jgi:hypothetical protein